MCLTRDPCVTCSGATPKTTRPAGECRPGERDGPGDQTSPIAFSTRTSWSRSPEPTNWWWRATRTSTTKSAWRYSLRRTTAIGIGRLFECRCGNQASIMEVDDQLKMTLYDFGFKTLKSIIRPRSQRHWAPHNQEGAWLFPMIIDGGILRFLN